MNRTYVIQWKNMVNGRAGRGTRQFRREEAEDLANELNREYPQIRHEVVAWQSPLPGSPDVEASLAAAEVAVKVIAVEEDEEDTSEDEPWHAPGFAQ